MKLETLSCPDGSSTLYIPDMDETYHSRKGALTESEYVYLQQGLDFIQDDNIAILEFGLGTGLNALLSLQWARNHHKILHYTTVEKHPLSLNDLASINYAELLGMPNEWKNLHQSEWNQEIRWEDEHRLHKWQGDFVNLDYPSNRAHIVFYDAFAPSKQAEVWGIDYLKKAFEALKPGGMLVTYCAQGQFKRNLKEIGFEVETLKGPPGKTEMVRARKPTSSSDN
ncbi:MAG: tRNA (5-methylaminomethyl-2-thiouridine)(34)-methyltransferase MnmD [Bacteroidota bacterium]|nr:tRNA (5-methylaminomethyl-2-thiouridine)(34)-methyltransferase MnmD [Bacteroidota bacterium]MDX5429980.1 tRNA (5-methylaminomethyl-2-thiouridine)(34)-methyltransferase MnmD [Bacteroidota bacterium]MDX5468753.1 tRNA (5-methylaminomethyl-2-thiouridine)(34)-methyltransferase MnmD [Bacteroidota bacterium]